MKGNEPPVFVMHPAAAFVLLASLTISSNGPLKQLGGDHPHVRTSLAVGVSANHGALDGGAVLIHAPAEADGGPALNGQVAALLVTLGRVGAVSLGMSCPHLAVGQRPLRW